MAILTASIHTILAGRDANQHLFDHAPSQRIGLGQRLEGWQFRGDYLGCESGIFRSWRQLE